MSYLSELQKVAKTIAKKSMPFPGVGTIYYTTSTPSELEVINTLRGDRRTNASLWAAAMCIKSLDEKGARMFANDEYAALLALPFVGDMEKLYEAMHKPAITPDDAKEAFGTPQA